MELSETISGRISLKSFWGLGVILFSVLSFSIFFGAYPLKINEVINAISPFGDSSGIQNFLIWEVRIPRVLMGVVIGAGLAMSGAVLQGLFRNPLADPSLIGITSGSMLAAIAGIILVSRGYVSGPVWLGTALIFSLAAIGSWLSTLFIYRISTKKGLTSVTTMLLAGIATAALAGAITGLLTYISDEDELRDITFWTMGSLASGNWTIIIVLGIIICIVMSQMLRFSKQLDILSLGEQEAYYIGIDVQKVKNKIIVLTAFIVGPCVAVSGLIGFVALIVPHLMRHIGLGKNHSQLIISSAISGAILLVMADAFARTVIAPSELPIGILTALIGGPYFLWLLTQSQKEMR